MKNGSRIAVVAILFAWALAFPVIATTPPPLTQSEVNERAKALADKYGVQLGITPPLDFDFAAAEQALATAHSSQYAEELLPNARGYARAAASNSLEVSCTKKYWRLGIHTDFGVVADAHFVRNMNGRPSLYTSIDPAQYAVAGGGNSSINVEIRHVNGVRSWLSSGQNANVDARYTVRYWTFGFFTDDTESCPGSHIL